MSLQVQGENGSVYHLIEPQDSKIVEIEIPEGMIPWFKIWETGQALLSWVDPTTFQERN